MREESLNEACIRYLLVYFMDFLFLLTLEKQAVVLCQKQRQQTFGVFLFFCNYATINPQHKLGHPGREEDLQASELPLPYIPN